MRHRSRVDSSQIIQHTNDLLDKTSKRYRITVQVAKCAKRYRYEDYEDIGNLLMKPVIRAIIEMSEELAL